MQKLINFQSKSNNRIVAFSVAVIAFFITHPTYAKLDPAEKALGALKKDLIDHIIPLAAGVILLCLAIGYAGRYIGKDTFVRWAIGVVIAGSAAQLSNLLFKGTV
ncbi:VirB2 family type IV secretion system major pilin TrwL [Bartonella krasnovii]|uniref:TrwL6 protein n=1 Tax=Bartonella krasnovii TaxID=2267275 RepID=A0A5B9D3G4_9HYPH|nr:VirB2 family type IV secretion system major pilin TrwL [Bartonella krasnovii]QEE12879.1 TrwL6 protein [Bartonella krasnovii]UNF42066.1 VirB2 family type IV secretion system major pilin TrwL [Bartonella krasnovii]UNF53574.1 VirB2 family type IV secretion system major pilin TrwL [Bartonella krasnovii]UNF55272.1 VirB2 family type IV secretion system major pilin TrwL [Bartonella krasnovii]